MSVRSDGKRIVGSSLKLRYRIVLPAVIAVLVVLTLSVPVAISSRHAEEISQLSTICTNLDVSITAAWQAASHAASSQGASGSSDSTCPIISSVADLDTGDLGGKTVAFHPAGDLSSSGDPVSSLEGGEFVYVSPVRAQGYCLSCHGAGHATRLSDCEAVGTLEIRVPSARFDRTAIGNVAYDISFTVLLAAVCIVFIWAPLRKYVTSPIERLASATAEIARGDYGARVDTDDIRAKGELLTLTNRFNEMADSVQGSYDSIESEVSARTQELRRANAKLSDRQAQIQALNEQLVRESNYKTEFLYIISHELKTPLTAIMANSEVLRHETDPERRAALFRSIDRSSSMLLALINQVLDAARLDAGKMELTLRATDINDVVNEVDASIDPITTEKGVSYHSSVGDMPVLMLDADKVMKIITNLVSNAVKFTGAGGEVDLAVTYDVPGHVLTLRVRDTGVGISEDEADALFERFYQGDRSSSRAYGGTGLGLSIVKELSELHGGRAYARPLEVGSEFTAEISALPWEDEA